MESRTQQGEKNERNRTFRAYQEAGWKSQRTGNIAQLFSWNGICYPYPRKHRGRQERS